MLYTTFILYAALCAGAMTATVKITDKEVMRKFLKDFNDEAIPVYFNKDLAMWYDLVDISDKHDDELVEQNAIKTAFWKRKNAEIEKYDWANLDDESMRRQFNDLNETGIAILSIDEGKQVDVLQNAMSKTYSTARVCETGLNAKCYSLDPGVTKIMAESRDYDTLLWAWKNWRDASGKKMKTNFSDLVKLLNKAAKLNGYDDEGDRWRKSYETDNLREQTEVLYEQLKPMYQQLHAYVKKRLQYKYKAHKFPNSGHIPAHLLGNMWGQAWNNIIDLVRPYEHAKHLDITGAMVKQNYSVRMMFDLADNFFHSLGMDKMTNIFWKKSMFTKPEKPRQVICHASAWDLWKKDDYRIKMCTEVNMEDLITLHHEMGHIQYYMNYKEQPITFRDGANQGFHEALGDLMALSVVTPKHLKKIKLIDEVTDDKEADINFLMNMALEKVAFLPFGLMIDTWRWGVFNGSISSEDYTKKWWQLRCKYQGIAPAIARKSSDFDPGAKYHIPANVPYIRYFVAKIVQFQFHEKLCEIAGHKGPLHKCDIGGSKKAGEKLIEMLKMGRSKPWPEAMRVLTGDTKMDAGALVRYFAPLTEWLKKQNGDDVVGWEEDCPVGSFEPSSANYVSSSIVLSISIICIVIFM